MRRLGRLEEVACRFAALTGRPVPLLGLRLSEGEQGHGRMAG